MDRKQPKIKFVGLHAHSVAGSIFDALGYPQAHMDYAYENGCDALALTDHGNMNGLAYQVLHAKKMQSEGKEFKPWSAANPTLCDYNDCLAGYYELDSVCTSCPVNAISTAPLSTFCSECAEGKYQPASGQTACIDCFSAAATSTSAVCAAGYEYHRNVQEIHDYFINITLGVSHLKNMTQYCFDDYACLPCKPGQYEVNHECQPCALGTYQHNWASYACFQCAAGQGTMQTGSDSETACVCQPGFE